jgi:chromosome segregation ATPase
MKQVKESNRLELFHDSFQEVSESIDEEIKDLKTMHRHCTNDIAVAGKQREKMLQKHDECSEAYRGTVLKYDTQLKENEKEQQMLLLQLEKLQEKAVVLRTAKEEEERMQQAALSAINDAAYEIDQEVGKVKDLRQRSRAAIDIMESTKELSELIFTNARQKESVIEQALKDRRSVALHNYRQTLLESAAAHKIEAEDHNTNVQHLKQQLQQLDLERRQKAKTGLKALVDKLKCQIEELQTDLQTERSKRSQSNEKQASLEIQIEEVDKKYAAEGELETIEMLYEKRRGEIQHFWNTVEDNFPFDSVRQNDK